MMSENLDILEGLKQFKGVKDLFQGNINCFRELETVFEL